MRFAFLSYFWPSWLWSAENEKDTGPNDEIGMKCARLRDLRALLLTLIMLLTILDLL
jgi:hypothetical protein